ncbi:General stress protein 14 [Serratia liquefaciens]|nr:General stress protein 14 [Serratia liquefaciens]
MKVLLIYAHPEPRSLNGALKNFAVRHLQQAGHEVQVSDLYAMRWKAGYDADDSGAPPVGEFWRPTLDSKQAFAQGTQSADIAAEQEKLLWADTVIFQFPLWWFSMPAIMKGWIDRVYAWGFAYGVGEHSDRHWGDRYGEGTFVGKRAMLIVTAGGWAEHYSPRGSNGPSTTSCSPFSTVCCSTPALRCFRRWCSTARIKPMPGSSPISAPPWPSGWTRCGKPSPFHSAARIMAII